MGFRKELSRSVAVTCIRCGRFLPRRAIEANDRYCSRICLEFDLYGNSKARDLKEKSTVQK